MSMKPPASQAAREAANKAAETIYYANSGALCLADKEEMQETLQETFDRFEQQIRDEVGGAPFQSRVEPWMMECFGPEIAADKLERGDRLLEEVLELLQSGDYPRERVAALVDYVWGRLKGEPDQEVGGVMVTLAAYCLAHDLDMHLAGERELDRISQPEVIAKIRAKQAAKPTGSALPIPSHPRPDAEARAREIVNRHLEYMDGLARGQVSMSVRNAIEAVKEALALAPAERGAIVEECARLADRHAAPDGVPQIDYDQACHDIAAAIRQIKGEVTPLDPDSPAAQD